MKLIGSLILWAIFIWSLVAFVANPEPNLRFWLGLLMGAALFVLTIGFVRSLRMRS